jgi:hypothetical protein
MKRLYLTALISVAVAVGATAQVQLTNVEESVASETNSEAAYTKTIDKRAADIVAVLNLTNAATGAKVHELAMAQYRALRDWHEANDVKRKEAKGEAADKINASLKAIHEAYIASLSAVLTPAQVEAVKDKMTYGKVQFTFKGYMVKEPNMPEAQQQKVLELLKQAREEAMDAGSSKEKDAIFNRYKGKINNYLSSQGLGKKKPA